MDTEPEALQTKEREVPHVDVDRKICQNYGQCVFVAPEVFDLDDDGVLVYESEYPADLQVKVENAVNVCPVQAIALRQPAE